MQPLSAVADKKYALRCPSEPEPRFMQRVNRLFSQATRAAFATPPALAPERYRVQIHSRSALHASFERGNKKALSVDALQGWGKAAGTFRQESQYSVVVHFTPNYLDASTPSNKNHIVKFWSGL